MLTCCHSDRVAPVGKSAVGAAALTPPASLIAAAMIDRLVHHAEILALKGDSYRLRDKDLGSPPPHE